MAISDKEFEDLKRRVEKLEKTALFTDNKKTKAAINHNGINFSLNERAFANKYGKDKSPSKKFGILIAFHARGDASIEVSMKQIQTSWDRMKSLLGNFNRKYSTEAKTFGWVNSPKKGFYTLAPGWEEVFKDASSKRKTD